MNIEQLKHICHAIFGDNSTTPENLQKIEHILAIQLPDDFKTIATFYSGNGLSLVNDFAITHEQDITPNIVQETLKLRKSAKLANNFILLAKPSESTILLDTKNSPHIIWCNIKDLPNLATKNFKTNPYTRETYTDFFEQMLREEYTKFIEKKAQQIQSAKQNNTTPSNKYIH